jgi:hypothetical protein
MPGTNTLTFLEAEVNYDRKKFYNIGPREEVAGASIINLFAAVIGIIES